MTRRLPWAAPRHERLLLVLVAAATLLVVHPVSVQDGSHMCLTDAILHGRLTIDQCSGNAVDRSIYGGHLYSNKAPGMSLLAIPAYEAVRLPPASQWVHDGDVRLWGVRLFASGLPFLLSIFLVGRVAEGLAPGFGGASLVTFALGTLMSSFAVTGFDHVPAAAFGFAAFALAWNRRHLAAGLLAGLAILVEYEDGAVVIALGVYCLLHGLRPLGRYMLGVVPGAALLAAYDQLAFGAPWHGPFRYNDNEFRVGYSHGFLGIEAPTLHAARLVFVGDRGLLVCCPVLVACAAGLVLLWRRGLRAEAGVCGFVGAAFLVAQCGYFAPYGGLSPGPRYLVAALPFFAVGLAPAFARFRAVTSLLAAASVVASTTLMLTWANSDNARYRGTVWAEIGRFLRRHQGSDLQLWLVKSLYEPLVVNRLYAAAIVCAATAAAFAVAVRPGRRSAA